MAFIVGAVLGGLIGILLGMNYESKRNMQKTMEMFFRANNLEAENVRLKQEIIILKNGYASVSEEETDNATNTDEGTAGSEGEL